MMKKENLSVNADIESLIFKKETTCRIEVLPCL